MKDRDNSSIDEFALARRTQGLKLETPMMEGVVVNDGPDVKFICYLYKLYINKITHSSDYKEEAKDRYMNDIVFRAIADLGFDIFEEYFENHKKGL